MQPPAPLVPPLFQRHLARVYEHACRQDLIVCAYDFDCVLLHEDSLSAHSPLICEGLGP